VPAPSRPSLPAHASLKTLIAGPLAAICLASAVIPAAAQTTPIPVNTFAVRPSDGRDTPKPDAGRRHRRKAHHHRHRKHRLLARTRPVNRRLAHRFHLALARARRHFGYRTVQFAVRGDGGHAFAARAGLRPSSRFVIGSVTKTFVAALTLRLVELGKLRLGAPASRYLDGLAARRARGATIRELLGHRSGIRDLFNPTVVRRIERHPQRGVHVATILRSVPGHLFAPGGGYSYSNTNYLLLGQIAQRVTHTRLDLLLQRRFLHRLHLRHTRTIHGAVQTPRLSRALASAFWGSGAMTSTPSDLARWGQALYGRKLLRARTMSQMLNFGRDAYGLGAQRLTVGRFHYPGHSGLLGHDTTLLVWLPGRRVSIAAMVNRPSSWVDNLLAYRWKGHASLLDLARRVR
jgi:CubicO group peptidase (beta-lactamase class C family)